MSARNKAAELRAAMSKANPPSRKELCEQLDVEPWELARMISRHRSDANAGTGARRPPKAKALPVLDVGSGMGVGSGERRETCVNYSECLGEIARRTFGDAHCPKQCARYEEFDRWAELQERARSGREAV